MTSTPVDLVSITDQQLQQRSECNLYMPIMADPLQGPADQAFRWAIKERSEGKIRSAAELRERFASEWLKDWNRSEKTRAYWAGIEKAAPFARRDQFLLKHRVLRPFEPYTLQLDCGRVTGGYVLMFWDKYRHEPVPLDILIGRDRF